jgi:hypothetical protein
LLARRGHTVAIELASSGAASRARCVAAARAADLVLLQRRLWSLLGVRELRSSARRLIFDIDDAVRFKDGSRGGFTSLARMLKFRALCRAADLVTAGNAYLADLARDAGAHRVEIFPTLVLAHELAGEPSARASGERLRLVWLGGASTKRYLLACLPELAPVLEDGTCSLTVIAESADGPCLPNTEYRRFDPVHVARWLRECHVGLAPLPDDPWTRGKCGLKVLEYGAAALPTIAAPVGIQRELVVPGHTGLQARTPSEWREAVRIFARDEPLRRTLGLQARALIGARYTWSSWEEPWARALEHKA